MSDPAGSAVDPHVKTRVEIDWDREEVRVYDLKTGALRYAAKLDKRYRRDK